MAASVDAVAAGGMQMDYSNTVTITPIPKNQVKTHHTNFPMKSEASGGVEIRMVVPIKEQQQQQPQEDTIQLSLEDIIIAGLNKKPQETNYQCTKAFAEHFDQPRVPIPPVTEKTKRHNSLDMEQGSPGDSDYESAQEAMAGNLPFKIRKQPNVQAANQNKLKKPTMQSSTSSIDLKIQKTIKNFFEADQS